MIPNLDADARDAAGEGGNAHIDRCRDGLPASNDPTGDVSSVVRQRFACRTGLDGDRKTLSSSMVQIDIRQLQRDLSLDGFLPGEVVDAADRQGVDEILSVALREPSIHDV